LFNIEEAALRNYIVLQENFSSVAKPTILQSCSHHSIKFLSELRLELVVMGKRANKRTDIS